MHTYYLRMLIEQEPPCASFVLAIFTRMINFHEIGKIAKVLEISNFPEISIFIAILTKQYNFPEIDKIEKVLEICHFPEIFISCVDMHTYIHTCKHT